jgi:hypothetical protein
MTAQQGRVGKHFLDGTHLHRRVPRLARHTMHCSDAPLWCCRAGLQVFAALEAAMSRAEDLHVAEAPYDTVGAKRLMTKVGWRLLPIDQMRAPGTRQGDVV